MFINRYLDTYKINEQLNVIIADSRNDRNGNIRYKYVVVYNKYLEDSFSGASQSWYFWGYGFNGFQELRSMVMKNFMLMKGIWGAGYRENLIIENCVRVTEWIERSERHYKFYTDRRDDKSECHYICNRGFVG